MKKPERVPFNSGVQKEAKHISLGWVAVIAIAISAAYGYEHDQGFAQQIDQALGIAVNAINVGLPILTEKVVPFFADDPERCLWPVAAGLGIAGGSKLVKHFSPKTPDE